MREVWLVMCSQCCLPAARMVAYVGSIVLVQLTCAVHVRTHLDQVGVTSTESLDTVLHDISATLSVPVHGHRICLDLPFTDALLRNM